MNQTYPFPVFVLLNLCSEDEASVLKEEKAIVTAESGRTFLFSQI